MLLEVAGMIRLPEGPERGQKKGNNRGLQSCLQQCHEVIVAYGPSNLPAYRFQGVDMQDQVIAMALNVIYFSYQLGLPQACRSE